MGSVVGTRSVKIFTKFWKIDGNPSTIGGLLGDCQRRALSHVLVKENNTGKRVGVLGLRTCILRRNKVVGKWARKLALVHCIVED